jgi:hypothetical protein
MRSRCQLLVALVVLACGASVVRADDDPPRYAGVTGPVVAPAASERRLVVSAELGLGAPLGYFGVNGDVSLGMHLVIDGGVGMGLEGPQAAIGARLRIPVGAWRLGLGARLAAGAYEWTELVFDDAASKRWDRALWADAEVSLEKRFWGDYQVRWFAGLGRILNGDDAVCVENVEHCRNDHAHDGLQLPYVGVSLGWGWDF